VPRGTLPPPEPCVRLLPHTAPRSTILFDLHTREGCPPSKAPITLNECIYLTPQFSCFVVSFDGSPVPRRPSFEAGISGFPALSVQLPVAFRLTAFASWDIVSSWGVKQSCGWSTDLQGIPYLPRPVPKRVSTFHSFEMRLGWVLPLLRGLGVPCIGSTGLCTLTYAPSGRTFF
jgi:hypothetical protein